MSNELSETQIKRCEKIAAHYNEILKLEQKKFELRVALEQARRHLAIGLKSNSKMNQTESAKGWAANIGNARGSETAAEAELEKIKEKQREELRKIERIINI